MKDNGVGALDYVVIKKTVLLVQTWSRSSRT